MTDTTASTGISTLETLSFEQTPIRIVMLDRVPYFALEDICAAAGWSFDYCAAKVSSASFPAYGKRECWEETDEGMQDATALSPIGVWLLTVAVDPYKGQRLAAWAKREALRLLPDADPKDPRMYLTLSDDGKLPQSPTKFSGRRSEWLDLKDSDEYLEARYGLKTASRVETQRKLLEEAQKAHQEAQA